MSHADILDTLVQQRDAFKIMERGQSVLEKEKEVRQQFYDLIHEDIKAEFINGEVVMHSPVRLEHWNVSNNLAYSITGHVKQHKLGKVGTEKVMIRLPTTTTNRTSAFLVKKK